MNITANFSRQAPAVDLTGFDLTLKKLGDILIQMPHFKVESKLSYKD